MNERWYKLWLKIAITCPGNTRFACKIISAFYIQYIWHIKAGKVYTLEIVSLRPQLETVLAPVSYRSSCRRRQRTRLLLKVPIESLVLENLLERPGKYKTIQYNTIQCNAMHCTAMYCNALHCNAMQYNTIQFTGGIQQFVWLVSTKRNLSNNKINLGNWCWINVNTPAYLPAMFPAPSYDWPPQLHFIKLLLRNYQ